MNEPLGPTSQGLQILNFISIIHVTLVSMSLSSYFTGEANTKGSRKRKNKTRKMFIREKRDPFVI